MWENRGSTLTAKRKERDANKAKEGGEEEPACFPVTVWRLSVVKRIIQITSPGEDEPVTGRACLPTQAEEAPESGERAKKLSAKPTSALLSLILASSARGCWAESRGPAQPPPRSPPAFPPSPRDPCEKWRKRTASPATARGRSTSTTSRRYSTLRKSLGREYLTAHAARLQSLHRQTDTEYPAVTRGRAAETRLITDSCWLSGRST